MTPAAALIGLVADEVLGEPPAQVHPVVWFGSAMRRIEDAVYRDDRRTGVLFTTAGVVLAAGVGITANRVLGRRAATVTATALCAAGRMLDAEAVAIAGLLRDGDTDCARHRLRSLVGRRTEELDEAEISRAVIESVAENSVDAVTSSLFWASVGGAPAVLAHRAINTLDAMVGHRTPRYERFGWASARGDDLANYVPARLSALAVCFVRPARTADIWNTIRRDSPRHPSPNGGVIEAAYAAALGVQLGGVNRYSEVVENRGTLGSGPAPTHADIARCVALRRSSTAATGLGWVGAAVLIRFTRTRLSRFGRSRG